MTIVLIVIVILLLSAPPVAGLFIYRAFARRGGKYKERFGTQEGTGTHREWIESLPHQTLWMKNRTGLRLHATLLNPEHDCGCAVILLHGYLGNAIDHMGMFVPFYLERGFSVLLPDHRAHGKSEGRYIGFGETDSLDCIDWCNYLLKHNPDTKKILLHGISMGAACADCAAGNPELPPEVFGIVSDCAFSSCAEQFDHSLKFLTSIPTRPLLKLANIWCKLLGKYDLFQGGATEGVLRSTLPFLFIHGKEDAFVPTRMSKKLFEACTHPQKALFLVEGAKHFLSYQVDKAGYEEHLIQFLQQPDL